MGLKLIAQIVLIATAFIIVFTFVTPTLATIKENQDELFQYKEAVLKASQFNARLQELISVRDSFTQEDMTDLDLLLPSSIDQVGVMRDIEAMFATAQVPLLSLGANEEVSPITEVPIEGIESVTTVPVLTYQDFEVSFNGSYDQLKTILSLIEANSTLLEVTELEFDVNMKGPDEEGAMEEGEYAFKLILRTFGLVPSEK